MVTYVMVQSASVKIMLNKYCLTMGKAIVCPQFSTMDFSQGVVKMRPLKKKLSTITPMLNANAVIILLNYKKRLAFQMNIATVMNSDKHVNLILSALQGTVM